MGDFAAVNAIYGKCFPENPPARATFAVRTLPLNAKVRPLPSSSSPPGGAGWL